MSNAWLCQRGSTLLIPSGPQLGHMHLFALMIDPVVVDGYGRIPHVLLVSVVSKKDGVPFEDACTLTAGEHPFIEHDSYVDYRFTRLEPAPHVESCVEKGTFIEKDPCSQELLKKIISGALSSRRISREYKNLLNKVLFD